MQCGVKATVSAESGGGYHAVFRERWRENRSSGSRLGSVIRPPRWITAALVGLAVAVAAGVVAAITVTVPQTAAFPAVANGTAVSAVRGSEPAPVVGSPAQFRTATAGAIDAVVVGVTATEVTAQLSSPVPPSAGRLTVPAGREPLIALLAPQVG